MVCKNLPVKKVIISVSNDLISDNRVHKVATSLSKSGFNVLLVGRKFTNSSPINRIYKIRRFRLIFNKSALFYAELNFRLFFFLLFHKTDILLSNDLDTLSANFLVSRLKKVRLVYDSHELFTEVPELINRPKTQKIWLKIEKKILPKIYFAYTVCQSIADYYENKYNIKMGVIRNIPICINIGKKDITKTKRILIYQGAINIGRGLEEAIEAMQYLSNYELWIIGSGDIENELKEISKNLGLQKKVKFLGRKKLEKLAQYTVQADLGLSIEKNLGLNYYYALPNKIFDYIQAEIPVLCSHLPEMSNIIKKYNIGSVLESHKPKQIATQIISIFENKKQIIEWNNNLKEAKKELCWQNEEKKLMRFFN